MTTCRKLLGAWRVAPGKCCGNFVLSSLLALYFRGLLCSLMWKWGEKAIMEKMLEKWIKLYLLEPPGDLLIICWPGFQKTIPGLLLISILKLSLVRQCHWSAMLNCWILFLSTLQKLCRKRGTMCTNHNIPTWLLGQLLFHTWRVQFQHPRPLKWRNHHMTEDQNGLNLVNVKTLNKTINMWGKQNTLELTHPHIAILSLLIKPISINFLQHRNHLLAIKNRHILVSSNPDIYLYSNHIACECKTLS